MKEVTKQEPSMRCRKRKNDVKTGFQLLTWDKFRGNLLTGWVASGTEVARLAWRLLHGTWEPVVSCKGSHSSSNPARM